MGGTGGLAGGRVKILPSSRQMRCVLFFVFSFSIYLLYPHCLPLVSQAHNPPLHLAYESPIQHFLPIRSSPFRYLLFKTPELAPATDE